MCNPQHFADNDLPCKHLVQPSFSGRCGAFESDHFCKDFVDGEVFLLDGLSKDQQFDTQNGAFARSFGDPNAPFASMTSPKCAHDYPKFGCSEAFPRCISARATDGTVGQVPQAVCRSKCDTMRDPNSCGTEIAATAQFLGMPAGTDVSVPALAPRAAARAAEMDRCENGSMRN